MSDQDPVKGFEQVLQPTVDDAKSQALVKKAMAQVVAGKVKLADLFAAVVAPASGDIDKKPPVPRALTEAELEAARRLPEVYGKVVVTADRKLEPRERAALVEERKVIDTLLGPLKKRKDESIREVLANDLDHLLTDEQKQDAVLDAKGHYAVKQEVEAPGTGSKVQRIVSGGKPNLTIEHIERLHAEGKIDRKTYLAITRKPDSPRVMDEAGLHQAIQKNPRLFFVLAEVAEPTTPMTTIKVVADK